jgi:hypothetical protein
MRSPVRPILLVVVALGLLLASVPAASASGCSVSTKPRAYGPTYVTSLSVVRVSCADGKDLIRAYDRCRRARAGVRGRCPRVHRFRCSERRRSISTEFSAKVSCARGARQVRFAYSQFT